MRKAILYPAPLNKCRGGLGILLGLALTPCAQAGMPMLIASDTYNFRLGTLCFFALGFLVVTLFFKLLWNSFAKDFNRLPRLRYPSALAVMIVFGLVLYLLLTMIAGVRELMTPGAWVRDGYTYRLSMAKQAPEVWLTSARRRSIETLRDSLWASVARNGGQFPPDMFVDDLPLAVWHTISPNGDLFLYHNPGDSRSGEVVVILEPPAFDKTRLAVMANGEVRELPANHPLLKETL